MCITLCSTTVTTQILSAQYNVVDFFKLINPLDLINIPPDYSPETITKVSTTERNRMHNLTRQINNIVMGVTSTCDNTLDPRNNTNYHMVTHLQWFQL